MSGIYISGMEMPKSCFWCEFRTKIDPDNLLCLISQKTFEERFYHIEHRDQSCPLVPVPEHGRLIDGDALKVSLVFAESTAEWAVPALRAVLMVIDEMPTIIPADKEGEG